jgi:hypothetical protein
MAAQQESWIATAFLYSGTISSGQVACLNAAGDKYLVATLANRAAAGRPAACLALSSADTESNDGSGFEAQFVGVVSPARSLLGPGTSTYVKVSDAGYLARTNTLDSSVVGRCDADGTAYVCFPLAGWSFGFTGFTAGGDLTGDATTQTVAKIQGVAISGTAASGKTLVASGAAAASWQTPSSGASPAGATGDIQVRVNSTTLGIVGFWTAVDNAGTLRASYWDTNGTTLRSILQLSGGAFYPSETFANGGWIRISDAFATGSLPLIAAKVGIASVGVLGMSGGRTYLGDPNLVNGTDILGADLTITGPGGITVSGATTFSNAATFSSTATVTGALSASTLGVAAGTLTLRQKTTSQLGANTGVSTTDSFDDFARVQTTDATTTNLYTFTLPTNAVTTIDIRVTACKSDTSSADAWVGSATFKNAAGTVATVQAANITHRGATAWTVTIDNSTTTARVRVIGAAATTIEWAVEISYQVTRQS